MKRLMLCLCAASLVGCVQPEPTNQTVPIGQTVTVAGVDYAARVVPNESLAPVFTVLDANLNGSTPPDAPSSPAVRIAGASDLDTAIRALAKFCGYDYERVKDWGAYGDPIWIDPATNETVIWTDTCGDHI